MGVPGSTCCVRQDCQLQHAGCHQPHVWGSGGQAGCCWSWQLKL